MATSRSSISRRTLAKGAAWAVPVIATAAAAPAAVASEPPGGNGVLSAACVPPLYPSQDSYDGTVVAFYLDVVGDGIGKGSTFVVGSPDPVFGAIGIGYWSIFQYVGGSMSENTYETTIDLDPGRRYDWTVGTPLGSELSETTMTFKTGTIYDVGGAPGAWSGSVTMHFAITLRDDGAYIGSCS